MSAQFSFARVGRDMRSMPESHARQIEMRQEPKKVKVRK